MSLIEWLFGVKKFDLIAPFYDNVLSFIEKNTLSQLRRRFVPMVEGEVLDLAVGTGHNLTFYPLHKISKVCMIDLSNGMLSKAREKIENDENLKSQSEKFDLVQGPCESMPFNDEQFDVILSIDVMCSVDDQKKTLDEAYRVLKRGGKAIFVEHFKTGHFWYDLLLRLVTLITMPLVGASMVRETDKSIENSQFNVEKEER
ncbi:hypothetical protein C9374_003658 [Naegleria lovaniensis]|uniref:Methyltransferase type 11 domain-containing protein n=1 Tax=Naegleria lovaniensis TaxID=51637 RepID=A0AA88KSQ5_NAELO|nr:uncharacterized protein C9374_003658 [Naegleria lovaniensis]KAG2393894.1 hypothetical protein C9374_003658 [Naegleria lovaniensis]